MSKKQGLKIKKNLKKIWHFIWESNSPWSWVVNILLAFIIIKFLVYPGLGFALGTTHPVVAVISGSMEHESGFDDWWSGKSCCVDFECSQRLSQEELYIPYLITKKEFKEYSFSNGFNKGDLIILKSPKNIEVGDVIVFRASHRPDPIIHRVVSITEKGYTTKGDNNCGSAEFELEIPKQAVIGKALFKIPFLGWIKLGFMNIVNLIAGG